jgi:general secretion pathway protein G
MKTPLRPQRRTANSGFTLLELLVVVAIIALLASYVGPRYFSQVGKSQRDAARAQLDAFAKALDTYRLDTGGYPSADVGLRALVERPPGASRWNGPYLQRAVPLDPWDMPYVYVHPGRTGEFDLLSLGPDRKPGGTGDDADISWR